jgi:hypothetical protein
MFPVVVPTAAGADGRVVTENHFKMNPFDLEGWLSVTCLFFMEDINMWNEPTKERLAKIPKLYETEEIPLQDKLIYLHLFIGGCDWYIAEYDRKDLFWGFAILNNDFEMAEWGYISFSELKFIKLSGCQEIDCELEEYFPVQKASEIENICSGNGWFMEAVNG